MLGGVRVDGSDGGEFRRGADEKSLRSAGGDREAAEEIDDLEGQNTIPREGCHLRSFQWVNEVALLEVFNIGQSVAVGLALQRSALLKSLYEHAHTPTHQKSLHPDSQETPLFHR